MADDQDDGRWGPLEEPGNRLEDLQGFVADNADKLHPVGNYATTAPVGSPAHDESLAWMKDSRLIDAAINAYDALEDMVRDFEAQQGHPVMTLDMHPKTAARVLEDAAKTTRHADLGLLAMVRACLPARVQRLRPAMAAAAIGALTLASSAPAGPRMGMKPSRLDGKAKARKRLNAKQRKQGRKNSRRGRR